MEKKEYITPAMEVVEVVKGDVICASPPEYDGPFGAKFENLFYFTDDSLEGTE